VLSQRCGEGEIRVYEYVYEYAIGEAFPYSYTYSYTQISSSRPQVANR